MRYVIDTNFIIKYFRGDEQALKVFASLNNTQISISALTYLELATGEALAGRKRFDKDLSTFIKFFELLPLSGSAAMYAGREALRLGRGKTNADMHDLAIGATAREFKRTVLTENVHDFSSMVGVKVKDWREL